MSNRTKSRILLALAGLIVAIIVFSVVSVIIGSDAPRQDGHAHCQVGDTVVGDREHPACSSARMAPPLRFRRNQAEAIGDVIECPEGQWPVIDEKPLHNDAVIFCAPKP